MRMVLNLLLSKFLLVFAFYILPFTLLIGCQKENHLYHETRVMMGTFVEVQSDNKDALGIAFNEIKRIESLLSKYSPGSDIYRLNETGSLKASTETMEVISKAKEFWAASGGMFDITVGPLMDIWGFREYSYKQPKQQEILAALNKVGFEKISINRVNNLVEFKIPGMKIDLGAIAAGYAVDSAIAKVKQAGIKNCLINAGGDIYCLGANKGRPWFVGIQSPGKKTIFKKLRLKDKAVTTSAGYERFLEKDGRKYTHFMNPQTGYPLDFLVPSVTVIADDCLTADVLATVIVLLGKEKGSRLLAEKYPGVKAEIIE